MTVKVECYEWAVVRLAALQRRGQPGRLLFATVTVLAPGRQPPTPMRTLDKHRLRSDGGTVYFRKVLLDARSAIDWYRTLGQGEDHTPVPSRAGEALADIDGVAFEVSQLEDDPVWPHLGLPMGDSVFAQPTGRDNPAPFMGNIPSRLHRRFGRGEGFEAAVADDNAILFIARRLHIDLRSYPEYLGSVALVVPDPVLLKVENFMLPAGGSEGERIFYRFVPRQGQDLAGLRLTTFDEEAHLLTSFESRSVPEDGILVVDKGSCAGKYGYVITHDDHGVLMYSPPTGFLRQVSVNIHANSSGEVNVSVPVSGAKDSPRMTYRVPNRSQLAVANMIGDKPVNEGAHRRIAEASAKRLRAARAATAGQRWFPSGSREEAMRFVQAEIGRARSRVIVADPYFGELQVGQFLYATSFNAVRFTLITSSLAFKSSEGSTRQRTLDDFKEKLEKLKSDIKVSPEVFVLKPSVLHDRFLVVDETVWFLGNSLNALGEKASMLVKLPDPDDVTRRLESMLATAVSFETFAKTEPSDRLEAK